MSMVLQNHAKEITFLQRQNRLKLKEKKLKEKKLKEKELKEKKEKKELLIFCIIFVLVYLFLPKLFSLIIYIMLPK